MIHLCSSPRICFAIFLALLCLSAPTAALSQGKCGYLAGRNPGPWVSVEGGGGIALPIPLSGDMGAKSLAAGFAGGVHLHLPRRGAVGIVYLNKEFREQNSAFEYGKYHDLLVRGSFAAVLRQYVQWDLHLLLGLSFVTVQFMDIDKDNPQTAEQNGKVVVVGPIKRSQVTTLTGGLGTRLAWFPVDPVGIYLDLSVLYAYQASLKAEDGAMNLNTIGGMEIHF
jgi:hypothetical protein